MLGKKLQGSGNQSLLGQFLVLIAQGDNLTGSLGALARGVLGNHELSRAFGENRRWMPPVQKDSHVYQSVH
jgi:hypothetical protein